MFVYGLIWGAKSAPKILCALNMLQYYVDPRAF